MAPIHVASEKGNAKQVRGYLAKGIKVDTVGWHDTTPLHFACEKGHTEVVQLLLETNANVEAKEQGGWSPLHCACRYGHKEAVQLLLEKGAIVDTKNNGGWTPLHSACSSGHRDVAQLLLERDADVEINNCLGWTPLHLACKCGHKDVVLLLLKWNANLEAKNKSGKTPLDLCNDDKMKQFLRKAIQQRADRQIQAMKAMEQREMEQRRIVKRKMEQRQMKQLQLEKREMEQRLAAQQALESLNRFALCVHQARADTAALAQQAASVALPTGDGETLVQFIADVDACYQHTTHVRQARQQTIELVTRCCVVLRGMENASAAEDTCGDFKRAEVALETFNALQTKIHEADSVEDRDVTQRDRMRRECVDLIETALQQHRPTNPNIQIGVSAIEALAELRTCPPDPLEDDTNGLNLEDVQRLCRDASGKGVRFACDLGNESAISAECDATIANVREKLVGALLREFGYSDPNASSRRKHMGGCVAVLSAELAFQERTAHKLSEPQELVGVLCALESALEAIVAYCQQANDLNGRCAQLRRQHIQLTEGLTAPDLSVVESQPQINLSIAMQRKQWKVRILMIDTDTEEAEVREKCAAWERDTRARERAAGREVAAWLQFVKRHYPELVKHPSVLQCFTADELECARLGLLLKGETEANYPAGELLSGRPGRNVWQRTDASGKDVVVKSYNLASPEHRLHFLRTCAKLGALRGVLNMVPVVGVFTENDWGRVLMPYYANGDLSAWISAYPQRDPALCLRMAHQITSAVLGLHELDIVHCDLKPKNIFITSTHEALLGGFIDIRDAKSTVTSAAGTTREYAAPEIRSESVSKFEKSADVYSLGIVLRELLHGLRVTGIFNTVTDAGFASLIQQMTADKASERPTLTYVLAMPIFSELHSARLCGGCLDTYAAVGSLTCKNGHVVCNDCVDRALAIDMNSINHVARHNGLLPCIMRRSGCDGLWEFQRYVSHVTKTTFDTAICLMNKPEIRAVLLELRREAAEDREFKHIANEILPLRCPAMGHVLDESFDTCFALTCDSCPRENSEFCALCWGSFGRYTYSHVVRCALNPRPGHYFNAITVFHELRRKDRSQKLRDYWATLQLDETSKEKLAERVQPLLDQLKPEGTYDSISNIVA
ncbi:serine/threonine protein kinase [Sphaeroforma arctica JP610]|uniref:Serine/threonine protein kinase n=1 Tax=Sphaeroforma arctica JP610 TaxID=667725 RepID=A0A0L0FQ24_9EUKA|nr:serine/threonine protein kinase [Sphaeroforma arctica JP610]KNC78910.1 serine/threonine protein kinase [Sphaeroforma arctica JP610]|eukprot:XP_014152812.1 serine/threonine protein kinase [Sphaeroforma arctica JP610]